MQDSQEGENSAAHQDPGLSAAGAGIATDRQAVPGEEPSSSPRIMLAICPRCRGVFVVGSPCTACASRGPSPVAFAILGALTLAVFVVVLGLILAKRALDGYERGSERVSLGVAERVYQPSENEIAAKREQAAPLKAEKEGLPAQFVEAAEQGDLMSQLNLGIWLAAGAFGPVDAAESRHWFELASERGDAFAAMKLGELSIQGVSDASQLGWFTHGEYKTLDDAVRRLEQLGVSSDPSYRIFASSPEQFVVVSGPVLNPVVAANRAGRAVDPREVASFTSGSEFRSLMWMFRGPIASSIGVEKNSSGVVAGRGLRVRVRREDSEESYELSLESEENGTPSFKGTYRYRDIAEDPVVLSVVDVDPSSTSPELLMTAWTGGAHCCAVPVMAYRDNRGEWAWSEFGMLDGQGYQVVDLNGDGVGEFVGPDQSFLYAFDSYSMSFAPRVIYQFRQGELRNVSTDPQFRRLLLEDLADIEEQLRDDPKLARSNGFLAAWVALKMRAGSGQEAWNRMLKSFDAQSEFLPVICLEKGISVSNCPKEKQVQVAFPVALKRHLQDHGYWDPSVR